MNCSISAKIRPYHRWYEPMNGDLTGRDKALAQKYPFYKHPPIDSSKPFAVQPSGLVVFSKHQLGKFKFRAFAKGIGVDKLSHKGIVGVQLVKDERKVAIFTTHLQSGGKRDPTVKPDQLRECNEFIRGFAADDEELIMILAGDFNIDSTDTEADTPAMRAPSYA